MPMVPCKARAYQTAHRTQGARRRLSCAANADHASAHRAAARRQADVATGCGPMLPMGKEDIALNERFTYVHVLRIAAATLVWRPLTAFLQTVLPGLDWDMAARTDLADAVADVAAS